MKPYHEMTKREVVEHLRALYYAQPKADWDSLAVGGVILSKGRGWRITRVPPKRGFVMATNVMTGEVEKLLRSQYATPDLLVTDEATLAVLRTSHQEEIRKAMAAGKSISPQVRYDYPEVFTPYPESWDEKRREKARTLWQRINEMRAFHDSQEPPGWQFRKVDEHGCGSQEGHRPLEEVPGGGRGGGGDQEARGDLPASSPAWTSTIRDLKEQVRDPPSPAEASRKDGHETQGRCENRTKGTETWQNLSFPWDACSPTLAALRAMEEAGQSPAFFLEKHRRRLGRGV